MTGIKTGRSTTQPTRASVPLTRRQFAQAMTGGLATLALGGLFGCAPQQAAAAEALDLDEEWYRSLNAVYREREVKGFELLDLIGCSYAKPQSGLFVWGRLPEGAGDCFEFSDKLLYGCGVFITPGGIFGSEGNNYIRISLCSPVEVLERAKQRIREKM